MGPMIVETPYSIRIVFQYECLFDFKGMLNRLRLFYSERLGNHVRSYLHFFLCSFLRDFFADGSIEYEPFFDKTLRLTYGTLTGTSTPHQYRYESDGNEGQLHIPQISTIGTSLSHSVKCHTQDTPFCGGSYLSSRYTVSVFKTSSAFIWF